MNNSYLNYFIYSAKALVLGLTLLNGTGAARAGSIDALTASMLVQGTVPDSDFFLLTEFAGIQTGETLTYQSTSDASGWTSLPPPGTPTLFGTYNGTSLTVTYNGDLSAFQLTGVVTWTSSGRFGADQWDGNGSATFSDVTLTGFSVHFVSSLTVGSHSGSFDLMIPGTIDATQSPPEFDYLENAETGGSTADGKKKKTKVSLKLMDKKVITDVTIKNKIIENSFKIKNTTSSSFTLNGTVSSVPEPATLTLLITGLLGILGYSRRQSSDE